MIKGGKGGGHTKTGLVFEERVDFVTVLDAIDGYDVIPTKNKSGVIVTYNGEKVARCFKKHEFYRFLEEYKIDWRDYLSKRLLPDNGLLVIVRDTLFIIEIKFQEVSGSVDEKLQTCDFKRKQYSKLVQTLDWKVEYVYVLNDWFKQACYKDTLEYINSMNCHYLFNKIPLKWLGLPE
ncbi:hypothetical protein [Tenacibaculum sp. UWU-22]|uniref:hypothetical protein n=1 Tax=Tenacibaculum sp. UWU-22 TaxID=3234187 RepID=UPI0034DB527A